MKPETVSRLRCPVCAGIPLEHVPLEKAADGETLIGFLWCAGCRNWFPIEDGVLELLHGELSYVEDRARFWESHRSALEALGLAPAAVAAEEEAADAARRQQAHFDWYADNEHQTYSDYEASPFWRAEDAIAFGQWRPEIRAGSSLLDVACAQGRSTFPWIDLDLEILAFDISKPLIRQAREGFRKAKARARADFFVADATRFPLVSASFDYMLTYGVLHHVPDPERTCAEILRTLRPGGVYFGSENNKTVFRSAFDLLQRIWPAWHEEAGAHPLISAGEIRKWLEPLGCRVETRSSVFLPPHVLNRVSARTAESILRWTDRLATSVPGLRDQGGLVLFRAEKKLAAGERARIPANRARRFESAMRRSDCPEGGTPAARG